MIHSSARRTVLPALLAAAVLSARAAPADDEWRSPAYSASDIAIEAEAVPEGWKLLAEEAKPRPEAEKAISDVIDALREEQKLARAEVTMVLRSLTAPDGSSATLSLVDLWQAPGAFPAALEAKAKEKGWGYREMASPARLLVVVAPESARKEVTALQVKVAALNLADQALKYLNNRLEDKADDLARGSLLLDPGLAFAHVTLGILAQPKMGPGDPKPASSAWEAAVAEFRLALDPKASVPLTAPQRYIATGALGDALIWQGGEHNAEGRDRLKETLELAAKVPGAQPWGNRYNLACALGRLKDLDEAFSHLNTVLEHDAKERVDGIQHWRIDPDFDNLHADPRWAEILAKYPEGGRPPEAPPAPAPGSPPEPPSGVPPPEKPPEQPPVK